MFKKVITIIIVLLSIFCSCKENTTTIYTIGNNVGQRIIKSYGTIICDDIITATAPQLCEKYTELCYIGQHIKAGDRIAKYTISGVETEITAKHNGVVCDIDDNKNNICYYNTENAKIITNILESDIKYIEKGKCVLIKGEGLDKNQYTGIVENISPTAKNNDNSTYIECTIVFNNPDTSILPGLSVKIEFKSNIENSVTIPINAIKYDDNGYYVTITSNSSTKKKYLKDILFNNGEYTVCSGLNPGEKLIVYN